MAVWRNPGSAWRRILAICFIVIAVRAWGAAPLELVCDPPDFELAKGECHSVALDPDAGTLKISVAVDFPKMALQTRSASASLAFINSGGVPVYAATLSLGENPASAGFDELALRLAVDSLLPDGKRLSLLDYYLTKDANIAGGVNCLIAEIVKGKAGFYIGGNKMTFAGEIPFGGGFSKAELTVNTRMDVRRFEVKEAPNPANALMTPWTVETLLERFAVTNDPVERFWSFLDRDNDPKWAIPGGRYELAIVRNGDVYDIIYLSGATVEGRSWHTGMKKGTLTPTIFADHYQLSWTDSRFQTDYPECSADLSTSNTILTLNFPLHHSQIRFSRKRLK